MACSPLIALALKTQWAGYAAEQALQFFGGILVLGLLFVSFGVQKTRKRM